MVEGTHIITPPLELQTNRRRSHLPIQARRIGQALNVLECIQSDRSDLLRPGQFEVFGELIKHLLTGNQAGYIELPTGAGKTVIASWLIDLLGENAIIIGPTNEIVGQFVHAIHDFTQVKPVQREEVDSDKSVELTSSAGKHVIIGTHDAFRQRLQLPDQSDEPHTSAKKPRYPFLEQFPPDRYPILIIDEAQQFIGTESLKALRKYMAHRNTQIFALTATPNFNLRIGHSVEIKIGPRIIRLPLQDAVNKGVVCPFQVFQVKTGIFTPEHFSDQESAVRRSKAAKANREIKKEVVPEVLRAQPFADKKTIIRYDTVDEARKAADLLQSKFPGRSIFFLHGKMPTKERRLALEGFRNSSDGIMCGADIVGVGLDVPDVSVVVIVGETKSSVELMQTAGRALRPSLDEGIPKTAYIVHVTSSKADAEKHQETATYIEALIKSGQGIPEDQRIIPRDSFTVQSSTYGAEVQVYLNQIGEVKKSQKTYKPGKVPLGYISLSRIFGQRDTHYKTDLYSYIFSLAFHEISPEQIYIGSSDEGQLIHPPTIYVSPQTASRCRSIYQELENWDEDEYVSAAQVADYFGYKYQTAREKLDTFYPQTRGSVLGIKKRTEKGGGGQLIRLYPQTVLNDPRIGQSVDMIDKKNPDGHQIWYSIPDLRTKHKGFPRARFIAFAEKELQEQPQWQMESLNSRRKKSTFYHRELVQKFLENEIQPVPENWLTRKEIRALFGIRETKIDSLEFGPDLARIGKKGSYIAQYFSPQAVNAVLEEYEEIHGAYAFIEKIINVIRYRLVFQGAQLDEGRIQNITLRRYNLTEAEYKNIRGINSNSQPRFKTDEITRIIREYLESPTDLTVGGLNYTPL